MTLADVCVCVSTSTVESLVAVLTLTVLNTNLDIYQSAASWLHLGFVGVVVVVFRPAAA